MDNIFFLSCFLPLTLAVYWLVPRIKGKNAVLLVFSLLFYSFEAFLLWDCFWAWRWQTTCWVSC